MGRQRTLAALRQSYTHARSKKLSADLESEKMEVEEQGAGESYVSSGGSGGSVNVSLHPLVIMNISDHFTRVRVQQQDESGLPIGALQIECWVHNNVYCNFAS